MKNKPSQSGFTLIELIAVMVILGILAAVIIPRISTITSGAYESNVRAMYGLIKNEVNAQAMKAAMSGGAGGHLETYPEPLNTAQNYYLDQWVDDYDPDMWTQFNGVSNYANGTGSSDLINVSAVLFMYHPHGRPNSAVTWASGANLTPSGGNSASLEDFYWIYYAPRTSHAGNTLGRTLDGYVMAAWVGSNDLTFDGSITDKGVAGAGGEAIIDDLTFILGDSN